MNNFNNGLKKTQNLQEFWGDLIQVKLGYSLK